ncbi:MAG: Xaa-Pro peptidase family protein [Planctomycetota bacterium]|nr:Xaa-Pro peptidase family protein [Planctomycetota bacterium]
MTGFATPLNLDVSTCRDRQNRLTGWMQQQGVDHVWLVTAENVQYFTSYRTHRLLSTGLLVSSNGHCTLFTPNEVPTNVAADEIVSFVAQHNATLRQDQTSAISEKLMECVDTVSTSSRWGIEFGACPAEFVIPLGKTRTGALVDADPILRKLRRRKDADELAMLRRAIACSEAMYQRAREIIRPGISEIEVYSALQSAAVEVAGEPLTAFGNDFQCGTPGGPPRPRLAEAGELFILDLGPAYRGYYADSCRTFAVSPTLSTEQEQAWEKIVSVLKWVEETVKPGVSCKELFLKAQEILEEYRPGGFIHHLGHGVGLYPHETPHLNSAWDDVFEEGDVFTAEPGLYGPELRGGIRLEHMYRVTRTGIERLIQFPLEMIG